MSIPILEKVLCGLSGGCDDKSVIPTSDIERKMEALADQASSVSSASSTRRESAVVEHILDVSDDNLSGVNGFRGPLKSADFDSPGYGLRLARQGTTPNVRLYVTFDGAGEGVMLAPGEEIRTPFSKFRLQLVSLQSRAVGGAPCRARVLQFRTPDAKFSEDSSTRPSFRPQSVLYTHAHEPPQYLYPYNSVADPLGGDTNGVRIFKNTLFPPDPWPSWGIYPYGFRKIRIFMRVDPGELADEKYLEQCVLRFLIRMPAQGYTGSQSFYDGPTVTIGTSGWRVYALWCDYEVPAGAFGDAGNFRLAQDPVSSNRAWIREQEADVERPYLLPYWVSNTGVAEIARVWAMGIE